MFDQSLVDVLKASLGDRALLEETPDRGLIELDCERPLGRSDGNESEECLGEFGGMCGAVQSLCRPRRGPGRRVR